MAAYHDSTGLATHVRNIEWHVDSEWFRSSDNPNVIPTHWRNKCGDSITW